MAAEVRKDRIDRACMDLAYTGRTVGDQAVAQVGIQVVAAVGIQDQIQEAEVVEDMVHCLDQDREVVDR